jgi:hypothetical protein
VSFLNLSLGELLGLVGAISAGVVALYLLDRSKRKQVVSTLRFWVDADIRTQLQHRRKIQQPWSLLLELLSLFLLVAAIAGPRLGIIDSSGRDHVLILDTSAWMGSRLRQGVLLDQAKDSALSYLKSLPRRDRVMLVRADALATPATAFDQSRANLEQAVRDSQPGFSALNLEQAIQFAQRAQKLQTERPGEIVFAGAGRVPESQTSLTTPPANLRVLSVGTTQENVGLRKIGLRRSPSAPDTWDIFVAVHNYGARARDADLELQFAQSPVGAKTLHLKPGGEEQATFSYKTKIAGYLEARLNVRDVFPQDDRALIELPAQTSVKVEVYSSEPQMLRALIAANPQVEAVFESPEQYNPGVKADVVVLDRFAPPVAPKANSIWIQPPASGAPVKVRETRTNAKLDKWRPETELGAGLRTQEVVLESAQVLALNPGDITVAETAAGPLVVARQAADGTRLVQIGFHPGAASMKYQVASPLLMANTLRWLAPEGFRRWDVQAGTVGNVSVPLEKDADAASIRVLDADRRPLPFTVSDGLLQFFSGAPGAVRVLRGDHETVYSLTLPDVAEAVFKAPANARHGIPKPSEQESPPQDLWPWLAFFGGLGLLIDWLLYGRSRMFRLQPSRIVPWPRRAPQRKAS